MSKKKQEYRVCIQCSGRFLVRNYNQRFCQDECRETFHNEAKQRAIEYYRQHVAQQEVAKQ